MSRIYLFSRQLTKSHRLSLPAPVASLKKSQFSTGGDANEGINGQGDDVKDTKKTAEKALNKLNDLLTKMVQEDVVHAQSKLSLAQPKNRRIKPELKKMENNEKKTLEEQTVSAAKSVAESLGGNRMQTESELLLKLLQQSENKEPTPGLNLNDIVKGMKIDRESKSELEQSRANQVRQVLGRMKSADGQWRPSTIDLNRRARQVRKPKSQELVMEKIDLFGSEPLGIFKSPLHEYKEGSQNQTWDRLYERELKLATTHPPNNYFQQMIQWTEQGKVWKFPIDNEQGMEQERNVYFADHVFLDGHLEGWCPPKGPIRHFMELVCVGLSKNPYLTVAAKKEHIEWYRTYFEDKKKLLQEVGAFSLEAPVDGNQEKAAEIDKN